MAMMGQGPAVRSSRAAASIAFIFPVGAFSPSPENRAPENRAPENRAPENRAPENRAAERVFSSWPAAVPAIYDPSVRRQTAGTGVKPGDDAREGRRPENPSYVSACRDRPSHRSRHKAAGEYWIKCLLKSKNNRFAARGCTCNIPPLAMAGTSSAMTIGGGRLSSPGQKDPDRRIGIAHAV